MVLKDRDSSKKRCWALSIQSWLLHVSSSAECLLVVEVGTSVTQLLLGISNEGRLTFQRYQLFGWSTIFPSRQKTSAFLWIHGKKIWENPWKPQSYWRIRDVVKYTIWHFFLHQWWGGEFQVPLGKKILTPKTLRGGAGRSTPDCHQHPLEW